MRRSLLLALVVALSVTGCLRDPDIIDIDDDAVAVHAVLQAGSDSALVFISRPDDDIFQPPDYRPVTGAAVRLIHGADTTWLSDGGQPCTANAAPGSAGTGCYRATLPTTILPGDVYELDIELDDGDRITGTTSVPAPAALTRPSAGARIPAACGSGEACFGQQVEGPPYSLPVARFQLTFDTPGSAGGTVIAVTAAETYFNGDTYGPNTCFLGFQRVPLAVVQTDSVDWRVPNIVCNDPLGPAMFDSIAAEIAVTVVDSAYARYLDAVTEGSSVRASSVREGIEGAYGVFGAGATATRRIMLVRQSTGFSPADGGARFISVRAAGKARTRESG